MSNVAAERLRAEGMAFLGKVIAVHSHDITNAFSVISEMAGLQLDLLEDAADGRSLDSVELQKICRQIRSYAAGGDETVRSLNWIAHRFDDQNPEIDLNEMLAKVAAAAEHLLKVRRAALVLEGCAERTLLRSDPFLLAYAILLGLDTLTVKSRRDKTITIGCLPLAESVEVTIENSEPVGPPLDDEAILSILSPLVNELAGEVKTLERGQHGDRIVLVFPRSGGRDGNVPESTKEAR